MVTKTWVGGGNNNARNPNDWTPTGVPKPGDSLSMTHGTMSISGDVLAGDTLFIQGDVHLATRPGATVNLSTEFATADVDVHGTLNLTAIASVSYLDFHGGTIKFIGSSTFRAFHTVFDDHLTGSGTINLVGGNASGVVMEVKEAVDRGLTFNVGIASGPPDASLQIDDPKRFHALLNLPDADNSLGFPVSGLGFVALMGLHATNADLHDEMLRLFDGCKLVDAVRVSGGGGLQVEQNSKGVMLSQGIGDVYQPGGPGTIIPLHIS